MQASALNMPLSSDAPMPRQKLVETLSIRAWKTSKAVTACKRPSVLMLFPTKAGSNGPICLVMPLKGHYLT